MKDHGIFCSMVQRHLNSSASCDSMCFDSGKLPMPCDKAFLEDTALTEFARILTWVADLWDLDTIYYRRFLSSTWRWAEAYTRSWLSANCPICYFWRCNSWSSHGYMVNTSFSVSEAFDLDRLLRLEFLMRVWSWWD